MKYVFGIEKRREKIKPTRFSFNQNPDDKLIKYNLKVYLVYKKNKKIRNKLRKPFSTNFSQNKMLPNSK